MPDDTFPEKRTRSQLALPDDILKILQTSPMKDARRTQTAARGAIKSSDEMEDKIILSPRKRLGRSKRSATPEPEDEYSAVAGSPSCGRELKRVRRDKHVDDKIAQHTQRLIHAEHANSKLETSIPAVRGSSGMRSATKSKKPTSTVSASPPPSIYSPIVSANRRAQSVPLLTTVIDIPRIDFRNPPPTPTRSRSSSPVKEKLRIMSGTSLKSSLPTIFDEQISTMDMSDGSTSVPEEKELLIEEPLHLRTTRGFPMVPATPTTDSLHMLMSMSPLTPIPDTPFPGRISQDSLSTDKSRFEVDTGWSTSFLKEAKPSTKSDPLSMTKSRLPRPVASPNNHFVKPPLPAATSEVPDPNTSATTGRKSTSTSKRNAFELLMMKKPFQDKAKLEGKTSSSKGAGVQQSDMDGKVAVARIPEPSIFTKFKGVEKPAAPLKRPGLKMKEKMRPRPKSKLQNRPLLIPMVDDEDEDMPNPDIDGEHDATDIGSARQSHDQTPALADPSTPVEETIGEKGHNRDLGDVEMSVDHRSSKVARVETTFVATKRDITASLQLDKPGSEVNQMEPEFEPSLKAGPSKLLLGKKRQPTSIATAGRVTRSASRRNGVAELSDTVRQNKPSALKRTVSGRAKKSAPPEETSAMDTDSLDLTQSLPPGSPMKVRSPAQTPPNSHPGQGQTIDFGAGKLRLAKSKSPHVGFIKPASTPSPSKIARATSMFIKPTITNVTRTDLANPVSGPSGSSLSTLSNALEKLRMPPPPRPNTSMGFNEDFPGEGISRPSSKDDSALSLGHSAVGLKRSVTLGAGLFRVDAASSSRAEGNTKIFVQKPLTAFLTEKGASTGPSGKVVGSKLPHFGIGGPIRRKISKKSRLPMVVGSPVKGDKKLMDNDLTEDASDAAGNDSLTFSASQDADTMGFAFEDLEDGQSSKGEEKATSKVSNASRRVSMVAHALSQSLRSLPQSSSKDLSMGPPPTPPSVQRDPGSTSSETPISSTSETTSPRTAAGTRSSARIATKMSQTKIQDHAQNSPPREDADVTRHSTNPVPESLKILTDCVVFVDVRTDEGDEAGSFFVEMLEGIGAKVLSRVGQTCTHIVYKNGLMSTLNRYRLLRDPKPLVVGIGWVVECVEQRRHVDETAHFFDLDGVNVAGINKRRRSILPKLLAASGSSPRANERAGGEEGEEPLNLSACPMNVEDDDLAPLERARRRKSVFVGLHS